MLKSLRRRFIGFSVLVISSILMILALVVYLGPTSVSVRQVLTSILIAVLMVIAGSYLLSKAAIRPIKNAWQKQLDFTADASHELRTPLAVIQTNLELVMDNPEATVQSQMKWLKNIEAENRRMAQLVNDLLTLSRADTDQQTMEKELLMLDEAVLEALIPLKPLARQKEIELCIDIKQPAVFYGDRKRLMQLVVILVDNAIKYTKASGSAAVSLQQGKRELVLSVTDSGCGMEAEHLSQIFDRFYRVNQTRSLNQDGSGLGLSIADWIVREHGGSIKAESVVDSGTVFTVLLPAYPGRNEPKQTLSEHNF